MPRSKTLLLLLLAAAIACSAFPLGATEKFHSCAYADPYSAAEVQFLATHYRVLAMGNTNVPPATLKAYHPQLKVLVYKALVSEFPFYTDAYGNSEWDVVNSHEDWFIHDTATGIRLQSTDGYPWYYMSPRSGWASYLAQVLHGWQAKGYDGFFGDNAFWTYTNGVFITIKAEPAVTIGDGRTVRTANGNGLYGIEGVYTNSSGTGTNYYPGGGYNEDTITLGSSPGSAGTRVYLTYYANVYRYREPATVDATGTTVTVRSKADWIYGVYDNPSLSGTSYYTGYGNNMFTNSGDRAVITLGRSPGAGRQVWVRYRAVPAPAADIASLHADMVGLFDTIRAANPGFLTFYNGIARRGTDEPYMAHNDGGMMEQFITVNGDNPLFYDGFTRWREEQERVEQITADYPTKTVMVQSGVSKETSYSVDLKNKWAMFCFASYLLCRGENSTFNFTKTGYNGLDWYPYWSLDYGYPLGPRKSVSVSVDLQGQGIFQRDFSKCRVIVNPTGAQAMTPTSADVTVTVPLDGAYRVVNQDGTISSTSISSITLPPRTGVILYRTTTPPPGGQAPPAPVITSPADGATIRTRQATVKGTESDATAQVTVQVGTTNYGPSAVSSGAWSANVNLAEGANKLTATAANSYGSTASAASLVTVDSQAPSVSITAPVNGSTVSGALNVVASAADPAPSSGLSVEFYLDGTLQFRDYVAPYAWGWTTTGLSGSHTVSARAVDAAGNAATSSNVTVTVSGSSGGTAPGVPTITSPAAGTLTRTAACTVRGSADSAATSVTVLLNGTAQSPVAVSGSAWSATVTLRQGANTLAAYAANGSGKSGSSAPITVTLDSRAPAVSFVAPTPGAVISARNIIEVGATDASPSAGMTKAELYFNGSLVSTITGVPPYKWYWTPSTTPATYTIRCDVSDQAGNKGTGSVTCQVGSGGTITQPPAVPVITSPTSGSVQSTTACTVKGTESTADATVTVLVNGAAQAPVAVSSGAWSTTVTLRSGDNSIAAYAANAAGKSATSAAVTVRVDSSSTTPVVSILSPAHGAVTTGRILIDGTATDPSGSGLVGCKLLINGYYAGEDYGAPPYRWYWTPAAGTYTIKLEVTNKAGGVGSATVTFRAS